MRYDFEDGTLTISGNIVRVPNIKFIRVIGEGANAVVLEGYNKIVQRQVAVKVWLPRNNQQNPDRRRFLAEIRKISRFSNDKILQIYNAGINRAGNNEYDAKILDFGTVYLLRSWLFPKKEASLSHYKSY
jgi:serine/threonine protein kinase